MITRVKIELPKILTWIGTPLTHDWIVRWDSYIGIDRIQRFDPQEKLCTSNGEQKWGEATTSVYSWLLECPIGQVGDNIFLDGVPNKITNVDIEKIDGIWTWVIMHEPRQHE